MHYMNFKNKFIPLAFPGAQDTFFKVKKEIISKNFKFFHDL